MFTVIALILALLFGAPERPAPIPQQTTFQFTTPSGEVGQSGARLKLLSTGEEEEVRVTSETDPATGMDSIRVELFNLRLDEYNYLITTEYVVQTYDPRRRVWVDTQILAVERPLVNIDLEMASSGIPGHVQCTPTEYGGCPGSCAKGNLCETPGGTQYILQWWGQCITHSCACGVPTPVCPNDDTDEMIQAIRDWHAQCPPQHSMDGGRRRCEARVYAQRGIWPLM